MDYLIDGYNLIFSLIESKGTLQKLREQVIHSLKILFAKRNISGILVFDGAHRRGEESGLSYPSPLIVAYAPKGQTADAYIVEHIELAKNPKLITVVTNDQGLARHARAYGAKVQGNAPFISWLKKPTKNQKKKEPQDTKQNIDRLLKIFEEKLRSPDEEEPP